MVSNLPADYAKTVVYPSYRELLIEKSQGKGWTWCEVCPDAIVCFLLLLAFNCKANILRLVLPPMDPSLV